MSTRALVAPVADVHVLRSVVLDILVPGAALLGPLWDAMADWNGLLNMVLVGLVNGAVYAAVLTLLAAGLAAVRRR